MASLNVIALVSGGKDSFFSAIHCLANGHRVVALANLHPPAPPPPPPGDNDHVSSSDQQADLNSFMYQTVGHQVVPLYAAATGIPLYRRAIATSGAVQQARDYDATASGADDADGEDETESMVPLLRGVMAAHPEANAVCAGAILSTYQRTRVESVALRLGLAPLAFLWKYPVVRPAADDAQLLLDMAAVGLRAMIVKVASGGLDESFLWEDVATPRGVSRLVRAAARFGGGAGDGAVLGEGGEFETLVVDGPRCLFRRRVVVEDKDRVVIGEGGGTAWLSIRKAGTEGKPVDGEDGSVDWLRKQVPRPSLLDDRFAAILAALSPSAETSASTGHELAASGHPKHGKLAPSHLEHWSLLGTVTTYATIQEETQDIVDQIRQQLAVRSLSATNIISAVIGLRRMADFPSVNAVYGALFTTPNPPSRVTVSVGDLLPPGRDVYVSLTVHTDARLVVNAREGRDGLHVQSRSYWAPANIGPYSQAVAVPLASLSALPPRSEAGVDGDEDETDPSTSQRSLASPRLVLIAGQIPLVPATMDLPRIEDAAGMTSDLFALQATLSLQHLWRISVEMGVQWWSSAVAYIPRTNGDEPQPACQKARIVSDAWARAHQHTGDMDEEDDADDEEAGPDVWDRKYNPAFSTYRSETARAKARLPDWSVVQKTDDSAVAEDRSEKRRRNTPPIFLAEVDELPRQSGVEWQAHAGFSDLAEGSVAPSSFRSGPQVEETSWWTAHQTLAEGPTGSVFVHTTVAIWAPRTAENVKFGADLLEKELGAALEAITASEGTREQRPYMLYVDAELVDTPPLTGLCAVMPCASLFDARGKRVMAVALYRETWSAA